MSKFLVTGTVSASKIIGVFEADTKKEAVKVARQSSNHDIHICHHCEDECIAPTITKLVAEEI